MNMNYASGSTHSSPAFPRRRSPGSPSLNASPEMIFQEVDVLLQVISPENSHVISKRILSLALAANDEEVTITLLRTVLDRASVDPAQSAIYLGLCQNIAALRGTAVEPVIEEVDSLPASSPRSRPPLPARPSNGSPEVSNLLTVPDPNSYGGGPIYKGHDEDYGNPFLTPKLGPSEENFIALNTPAMASRNLIAPPREPSPPLTPPKTVTRTSPSSTIPTIPSYQHYQPPHPTLPRAPYIYNTTSFPPPPTSPSKLLPALPQEPHHEVVPAYAPTVNVSSIERWLDGINDPVAFAPKTHSVNSISHILESLTPAYADTRDTLLACMDYADSKTICYVACAVAEKATESMDVAVVCSKLCAELEAVLSTAPSDDESEEDADSLDNEDAMTRGSQSVSPTLTLTGDMFKRLLAIFCWQNFEFAWVSPSHRSGADDHLVSGLIQGSPRRSVVLLKFIGELFRRGMLSKNFVHDCAMQLLDQLALPFEHVDLDAYPSPDQSNQQSLLPPQFQQQPYLQQQEASGQYTRVSSRPMNASRERPASPSPQRHASISPVRHREQRRPSISQHPSFSQQMTQVHSPPQSSPPTARHREATRRFAMGFAVFMACVGNELDKRSRRDVDKYLELMRIVAKKEAIVLNGSPGGAAAYGEGGRVETHLSYLHTLRANRWRIESQRERGRKTSVSVPPQQHRMHSYT